MGISDLPLVRIATAGSVDDGKSTLLGRLLFETGALLDDQVENVRATTARRGETGLNLALVTDGLRAEREQNITIDVAYRPFWTATRRFLLADSPGHQQYTRNMVTAASTADALLVLCDARNGASVQSRRHLAVTAHLDVPNLVLVINKMDSVDWSEDVYRSIVAELTDYAARIGAPVPTSIPVSALNGDNVVTASDNSPWYGGPTLLEFLNTLSPDESPPEPARLVVQLVLRGEEQARFLAGTLEGGPLAVGDSLSTPEGRTARVRTLFSGGRETQVADAGQPVAVRLDTEQDIARGDVLCTVSLPTFETVDCTLFWMDSDPLRVGMTYRLRNGAREIAAQVISLDGVFHVDDGQFTDGQTLGLNDLGRVRLRLSRPEALRPYAESRTFGSFVLVSPSHQTVAAGCILELSSARANTAPKNAVIWLTGLSGAGKSTLADAFVSSMVARGVQTFALDGDKLRTGLCSDLGFSPEDRLENIRRTAEVAKMIAREGTLVVCSLISPLREHRDLARRIVGDGFIEVFVDCPLDECIRRDPKGLYARALAGNLPGFTGIGAPYEAPESPELVIHTATDNVSEASEKLWRYFSARP
jgi:bifunctional enzyme CysN/CysC